MTTKTKSITSEIDQKCTEEEKTYFSKRIFINDFTYMYNISIEPSSIRFIIKL